MLTSDCPLSRAVSALAMIPPVNLGRLMPSPRRPVGDAGLAAPEPQPGAARDEVGGGVLVQADEAVVDLATEAHGLEQRAGVAGEADELAVGVGVGQEVTHCGLGGQ